MTAPPLTNREYAYFRATGKGKHEVFSKAIGVEAVSCWSEGDISPRTKKPYTFMRWNLESGLDDTQTVDLHIERLLATLEPLREKIESLRSEYEMLIQCVGYFPAAGHGIFLSPTTIQRAATLGLGVDCDFYYIGDHGHDLDYH